MAVTDAVLFGLVGGFLAEFYSINLHRYKAKKEWPKYVKYWWYWLMAVVWVAIGGFLAGTYESLEGTTLNALVALNVGATAPLIVEGLTRAAPDVSPGVAG